MKHCYLSAKTSSYQNQPAPTLDQEVIDHRRELKSDCWHYDQYKTVQSQNQA
ncbi:hypothetical protein D049_5222, partial [Vibrio parahaemolyticus VPTS-2010]